MIDSASAMSNQAFTPEQQRYLEGFFAGISARAHVRPLAASPGPVPASPPPSEDLTKEERIKREMHPLDAYESLLEDARANQPPEPEDVFRFKWNGLFWLNPVKDGYMCRLRIPGGVVQARQVRELAAIADDLTTGYIQITTRSNFQIRVIQPKDCPEVLRRLQACGLHSRGAGGDNIRNLTASPTSGFDPYEWIDVMPYIRELAQIIISSREFYNLPRKFNIAFDGGGLISCVEDTNDIGATAVRIDEGVGGLPAGVYFRLALGGVTGHQTFARDWGVLVAPDQLVPVCLALLRVFIRDGDRTSRKKARLKYLVESRGLAGLLEDTEALLKFRLARVPLDAPGQHPPQRPPADHPHVGIYPQKQPGLVSIGASVPVGQITSKQLRRVADLAEHYGTGEIRLTVWQNFILPHIPEAFAPTVAKQLRKIGFDTEQSHLRSGFVACTGNRYCKYAASDTKGHALEVMKALDRRITLDQPVNIHFTGCPHSCAQHFMADIGLLGAKVKVNGETVEGYHITLGGGFGEHQAVGRQVFTGVPFAEVTPLLERMLRTYQERRQPGERFQDFCARHELGALQEMFSGVAV